MKTKFQEDFWRNGAYYIVYVTDDSKWTCKIVRHMHVIGTGVGVDKKAAIVAAEVDAEVETWTS